MILLRLVVAMAVVPSMLWAAGAPAAAQDRSTFLAQQTIDCRGCDRRLSRQANHFES